MEEKINRCPICTKIVSLEKRGKKEKIDTTHGMCWSKIGYSINGWGNRKNFMYEFKGEVCTDCFNALKNKIDELKEVFEKRRNSQNEGICIYRTEQSKRNNVPNLQEDEFQPKRYKKALLRLLPFLSR